MAIEVRDTGEPTIDLLKLVTNDGKEFDLTPLLIDLRIYEDIFSPVLTGKVTILDTIGVLNRIPLTGNEKLTVRVYSYGYETPDPLNILHRTFIITRITDITNKNDYSKSYSLHFISPEFVKNETIKISKGYENSTLSNVVSRLMTEDYDIDDPSGLSFPTVDYTGIGINFRSPFIYSNNIEAWYKKEDGVTGDDNMELFIEKTRYTEPVISFPYMKPFDIIRWLASRSLRTTGRNYKNTNAANFLFFENKRGFQYTSLDTLYEAKDYGMASFYYGAGNQNRDRRTYLNRIDRIQVQDCHDIIKNIRNGMYSSQLLTYDLITGKKSYSIYDYSKQFAESESMERNAISDDYPMLSEDSDISEKELSKRMLVCASPENTINAITSNETQRTASNKYSTGYAEYLQNRLSQIARLGSYRVTFTIPGNSKHAAGDIINIDFKDWIASDTISPSKDFIEESNKFYSGNYMITSIEHKITKFDYNMNIEVCKDSFKTKLGTL